MEQEEENRQPFDVPPPLPVPGPTWRDLLIALAIIWSITFGLAIFTLVVVSVFVAQNDVDIENAFANPLVAVPLSITTAMAALVVAWYTACFKFKKSLAEGLAVQRRPARRLFVAAGLGLVGALLATILLGMFGTGESIMSEMMGGEDGALPLSMLVLALAAPVYEEIYYRGFLYGVFQRLLRPRIALGIVVLWFGAIHVVQLWGEWAGIPVIFFMGAVWTYLRHVSGSILPGMASHFAYNLSLVVISLIAAAFV